MSEPIDWAFTYDGPIAAQDSRACDLCNAASLKKCNKSGAQHGPNPESCATCHCAQIGYCPNHCGIEYALMRFGEACIGLPSAEGLHSTVMRYLETGDNAGSVAVHA